MKTIAAALAGLAFVAWTQAEPPPHQLQAGQPPYTSSRLTNERMERLVAQPLRLIESGRIEEARQAFRRQLAGVAKRHGANSVAVADHLVSFGMMVFEQGEEPSVRRLGIDYLRRGAAAYTAALGRQQPEVALTLSDVGNAWLVLDPANPAAEADRVLEESWRIRNATLGPRNVETASALGGLARLRGLPSRTAGDLGRIEASAALFHEAIRDFGTSRVVPGLFGSITAWADLARMYLDNGMPKEAAKAAIAAQADYRTKFPGDAEKCSLLLRRTQALLRSLDDAGHQIEAESVRAGLRLNIPCDGEGDRLVLPSFPVPPIDRPPPE